MNWTTEYPTKPGYYWLRNYQLEYRGCSETAPGPDLVEFQMADADLYHIKSGTSWMRSELKSGEWFGPILPPTGNDVAPLVDAVVSILNYPDPPLPALPPDTEHKPGIPITEDIVYE